MHQLKNGMKKAKMQLAAKLLQSGNHTPFRDIVTKSQYDFRFCYSFNYSFNISQNTLFKLKMSA